MTQHEGRRDLPTLLNITHVVVRLGVSKGNDATNAYGLYMHFLVHAEAESSCDVSQLYRETSRTPTIIWEHSC